MRKTEDMIGKTFDSVFSVDNKALCFVDSKNEEAWLFKHDTDCCESVTIEDVCGNLQNLVGSPLVMSELVTSDGTDSLHESRFKNDHGVVSATWSFYKFATIKGHVTVRWFGASNGCYSEKVDLVLIPFTDTFDERMARNHIW